MPNVTSIIHHVHTIAVVGFSNDAEKPSHYVAEYLHQAGYRIIAVNPRITNAWGEPGYASLRDIPDQVDLVLVFRRPEFCVGVVQDALAMAHRPMTIWLQSGITSPDAQQLAEEAGITFIQNHCLMVEHRRVKSEE